MFITGVNEKHNGNTRLGIIGEKMTLSRTNESRTTKTIVICNKIIIIVFIKRL